MTGYRWWDGLQDRIFSANCYTQVGQKFKVLQCVQKKKASLGCLPRLGPSSQGATFSPLAPATLLISRTWFKLQITYCQAALAVFISCLAFFLPQYKRYALNLNDYVFLGEVSATSAIKNTCIYFPWLPLLWIFTVAASSSASVISSSLEFKYY